MMAASFLLTGESMQRSNLLCVESAQAEIVEELGVVDARLHDTASDEG